MDNYNPASIHPPLGGLYSHGIEVPAGARLLFISGQLGMRRDGSCPSTCAEQLEVAWSNLGAILAEARMTRLDIVKVVAFLRDADTAEHYGDSFARYFGGHRTASSACIVKGLWFDEWFFEIEAVAARIGPDEGTATPWR